MRWPLLVALLAACNADPLGTGSDDMLNNTPDMRVPAVPLIHRPSAPACTMSRPAFNCSLPTGPFPGCNMDSSCVAGTNGRCVGDSHDGCSCSYDTCNSDADCASGTLCDCGSPSVKGRQGPKQCLKSNCRLDADCGPGGYCSPSFDFVCGAFLGVTGWFCHTASDTCINDSDCSGLDGGFGQPFCGYRPETGRWMCSTTGCAG